jgi:hypothetical protein
MTFNKPPEWGKRFTFPENIQVEYNGFQGSVTSEIMVKMAERYDDAVAKQIAMEAKLAGVADCTVLNKAAILAALKKQTPKKPTDISKSELYGRCAVCGQIVHVGNRYCDQCGQALDWGDEDGK